MKSILFVVALIGIFATFAFVTAQQTTVRAFLSDSDLNALLTKEAPLIASKIESVEIPDQHFVQHVDLVGDVEIDITNIKISNVGLGNLAVVMQSPNIITLQDSNGQIQINLAYAYKQQSWPHASGSGSAVVSTNTVNVVESVVMNLDINSGKPNFQLTKNNIDLGNLNINISGGSGWILSLLKNLLGTTIKNNIQTGIESVIQAQINQANTDIQSANFQPLLNVSIGASQYAMMVDYRLSELDVYNNAYLVIASIATFYAPKLFGKPLPFTPAQIPSSPPSQIDDLIDSYVTDYILNSLLYGLYASNQLDTIITPDMVPPNSPIQLNTTSLKLYLPQLYAKYPNKLVQLHLSDTPAGTGSYPLLKTTPSSISGFFSGDILFQVVMDDGSLQNAFDLQLIANASISSPALIPFGSKLNFTAQITNPNFTINVKQSWIGSVDVSTLQNIIRIVLINGYLPYINKDLQQGVTLIDFSSVLPGFQIINPNLVLNQGYLTAGVNGYYNPAALKKQQVKKNEDEPTKMDIILEDLRKKIGKQHKIKIQ